MLDLILKRLFVLSFTTFLILALVACVSKTKTEIPAYSMTQNLEVGQLPIVQLKTKNGEFFCSGTVISDDYVLTAAHCLADENGNMKTEEIQIVSVNDVQVVTAKAMKIRNGADLAIVRGDFKSFAKMKVMTSPKEMNKFGGKLAACGYPHGAPLTCYGLANPRIYYYQIAAEGILFAGMSGGPVIEAESMTVIAVNTAVGNGYVVLSSLVGLFEMMKIKVVQ